MQRLILSLEGAENDARVRSEKTCKESTVPPGGLLADIIPATGKSKVEVASLLGISRQQL